jgi:hypothetical protein
MRSSLWLSSPSDRSSDELSDRSSDELVGEETGREHHPDPRLITGPCSISPTRVAGRHFQWPPRSCNPQAEGQRRPPDNPEMMLDLRSYRRSTPGYPEVVRSYVRHRSAKLLFDLKTILCDSGMRGHSADSAPLGTRTRPRLRRLGIAPLWAGCRIGENPTYNLTGSVVTGFSANAEVDSPRLIEPAFAVGPCVVDGRRPT